MRPGTAGLDAAMRVACESSGGLRDHKPTSISGQPPATEPSKLFRKRSAEDDNEHAAAGKRRRSNEAVEYPKLPENASSTAKLFEAALNKPAASAGRVA